MNLEEAGEFVKKYNAENPEKVNGLLGSLWPLVKAHARGIPEIGDAKFKTWAELEWAGKIIDGHREKVEAEAQFVEAAFVLAQDAAKIIMGEILEA